MQEEVNNFNEVWQFNGQRGEKTRANYENILFELWSKPHYFKNYNGLQISSKVNGKRNKTYNRVINLAVDAGLFIILKNYFAGKHTRIYGRNNKLFKSVFGNNYKNWLKNRSGKSRYDNTSIQYEFVSSKKQSNNFTAQNVNSSLKEHDNNTIVQDKIFSHKKHDNNVITHLEPYDINYWANLDVATNLKLTETEINSLNYDIYKLYDLKTTMLPHYYNLMLELNEAAIDGDLKFTTFLCFDDKGLPSGRPWSPFCATKNDKKKHDKNDDRESRKAYLRRIGLSDYVEIFDMKSQVPRVNRLFQSGTWKPDSYDFYAEIKKGTETYKRGDELPPRGINKYCLDNEDTMKGIFMRMFFGKTSPRQLFTAHRNDFVRRHKGYTYEIYDDPCNIETIKDYVWLDIYNSFQNIVMPPIKALVFWFTFFLETEIKIELLKNGKKVYNVFDGFYYHERFKDETRAEIEQIMNVKAIEICENWMKPLRRQRSIIANRIVNWDKRKVSTK